MGSSGKMFLVLGLFSLTLSRNAYAYIDPGTGSLLVQLLVGAVVGAGLGLKYWKQKISAKLKRKPSPKDKSRKVR